MGANFRPDLEPYKVTGSFRFWCQKVLPLVYDDSLSYYELLCKVVAYLNDVIENVDGLKIDIDKLLAAYGKLEDYVNNYFNNLDVQEEINVKLDIMASDGTLAQIINEQIFNELNTKITNLQGKVSVINTEIDNINADIANINTFKNYPNVESLKNADLKIGETALTNSYYDRGVGGGTYDIVAKGNIIADDGKYVELTNGNIAVLRETPTPERYGITPTNCTVERINALFKNERVDFNGQVYTIDGGIKILNNCDIYGDVTFILNGGENTVGLSIGKQTQFEVVGTITTINRSDSVISIPNSLQPGDIVRISSGESWNSARTNYNKGELCEVKTSTNSQITVDNVLDSYTNASVYKIKEPIRVNIYGNLKVVVNYDVVTGISINSLIYSSFQNIECVCNGNTATQAMTFIFCKNLNIENLTAINKNNNQGDVYGLAIANCQQINIENVECYGNRHGVSLGYNLVSGNIVNRLININGVFNSGYSFSADMHGNAEMCKYSGKALDGVAMGGNNNTFIGEAIAKTVHACVAIAENCGYSFNISNSIFRQNSSYSTFVYLSGGAVNRFGGVFNVNNCQFISDLATATSCITAAAVEVNGNNYSLTATDCQARTAGGLKYFCVLGGGGGLWTMVDVGGTDIGASATEFQYPGNAGILIDRLYRFTAN